MSDSNENKTGLSLSDGLIIAIMTAAVYLSFLLKEIGYAREFDIPLDVISISEVGLVVAVQSVLLAISSYVVKVNLIWIFSPRGDSLVSFKLRVFIALSLLLGFAFYPYLITKLYLWILVGMIGALFFFHFIFPLITQRKIESYENKLIAQNKIDSNSVDIYVSLIGSLNTQWRLPLIIMLAIMFFSYGLGRKEALEQTSFLEIDGQPNWYVLKIYNDFIVSKNIDKKTKMLIGDIELTKLKNGGSIRLHKTEIGPINHDDNSSKNISNVSVEIPSCNFIGTYCWVT
jgi:hypothetical protein